MSNSKETCQGISENVCNNRRDFLVKASAIAGGFVLSLSGASVVKANNTAVEDENVVLKLDDKSPLGKVGGSQVIDTKNGKVIVVRTGEMAFNAYSALCTHKQGVINYDAEKKLLICPLHNSRFDADGKPVGGPAKLPLATYGAQESVVVTLTPKA